MDTLAADFLQRLPTRSASDPGFYGAVLWPAALLLAQVLASAPPLAGKTTFELGAGTGLASLAAATHGAHAIASDVYPLSLQLIQQSAAIPRPTLDVTAVHFDLFSAEPLPPRTDILLAADVLYLTDLTRAVARRVAEAKKSGIQVLLTDSRGTHQAALLAELEVLGVVGTFEPRDLDWLPAARHECASLLVFDE